ncbi:3-methyladenine DNA glycosylase [Hahella sp. CCB-MM4]|uniref:DNA-3-methyladenine glycosylase I n=1 Tax=Hahella sp. (strain CCB-MM4) TaxID=1926491 RepID=UPI000B9B301E|nr:DNA-3-methyladenine glycosylase I [Hahella sp. CCB-MM4]OZG73719.1 3-methyladenine DNA glycosylase [Hahella sp. CCB-MM4]
MTKYSVKTVSIADRLARVTERFGGVENLKMALPETASNEELAEKTDAYYLSNMTRRIFRAGLKHSLVDAKWPEFEKAFFGFDPEKMVLFSDTDLDERMKNKALIRHWGKMSAIPVNAQMITDLGASAGGFGRFLADWPVTDIVGLWTLLAKRGKQLGGRSAPSFLRMVGKDTFMLTSHVAGALIALGIVDTPPTAKRDLQKVQVAFNEWRETTGYGLAELSQILAYSQN